MTDGRRLSRWQGIAIWTVALGTVHAAIPLALSRRGRRRGWRNGRPGPANLVGAVPLSAGMATITWALAGHYASAPDGSWATRTATPEYLLTTGPYRYTRNPMYVGAIAIWTGWSVLLGSKPVAAGLGVIATGLQGAVAFEEHTLTQRWGDEYRDYTSRTARWLGRPRPA